MTTSLIDLVDTVAARPPCQTQTHTLLHRFVIYCLYLWIVLVLRRVFTMNELELRFLAGYTCVLALVIYWKLKQVRLLWSYQVLSGSIRFVRKHSNSSVFKYSTVNAWRHPQLMRKYEWEDESLKLELS